MHYNDEIYWLTRLFIDTVWDFDLSKEQSFFCLKFCFIELYKSSLDNKL